MRYGLSEKTIEKINSIFSKYRNIDRVFLYGSRAKGNYKNGSDIDLSIESSSINLQLLCKIELELDDLLLPYNIDLSLYGDIENRDLKEHIDRVGVTLYSKNR